MKQRVYRYDNIKALLIFLVVVGHMTTDYAPDSWAVRWVTVWIFSFHMPAFVLTSGILHKRYITEEQAAAGMKGTVRLRWDKVIGYILCAYALKVFLYYSRMLIWPDPPWHWLSEHSIPWYLFVMAEYELLFYLMRRIDGKVKPWIIVAASFALCSAAGYFHLPAEGDFFCLLRFFNFLPFYAIGYYLDMGEFNEWLDRKWLRVTGWIVIAVSLAAFANGPWSIYGLRKWFTGRRSYEWLLGEFDFAPGSGWWIRLAVWAFALIMTIAVMAVIPDREMVRVSVVGRRTLGIYFWHKPTQYLLKIGDVLPRLVVLFGGTYDASVAGTVHGHAFGGSPLSMTVGLLAYLVICALITFVFSLRIFEHPCSDIMKLCSRLMNRGTGKKSP